MLVLEGGGKQDLLQEDRQVSDLRTQWISVRRGPEGAAPRPRKSWRTEPALTALAGRRARPASAVRQSRVPRLHQPAALDDEEHKRGNVVERALRRLKQFRDLATHYAKRTVNWAAEATIAVIVLWRR